MAGVKHFSTILANFSLCLLAACASPPPAPIHARTPPPSERIDYHIVSKGETLFSLAWRYEKNINQLAAANGLRPPYTLRIGQKLSLDTTRVKTRVYAPGTSTKTSAPSRTAPAKPVVAKQVTRTPTKLPSSLPGRWQWQRPVPGRVSRHFNEAALFKGIDLQVQPGQAVEAAGPGLVVYAGNGLRGYGELIIVKHSEEYLSAYAHNRKILVREGQTVKGGQKISEAGGDPANRRRLYFEIRRDGKPVNPLQYLPKQ